MILHCVPPHRYDAPYHVLGYLKGFLQAEKIVVTNVYWNLILAKELERFKKRTEHNPEVTLLSSFDITASVWKWLMKTTKKIDNLYVDPFFLLASSREELEIRGNKIKTTVDEYIKEHNLHKASLSGFTVRTYQWMMSMYIMSRLKKMNPDTKVVILDAVDETQALTFMNLFWEADFAVWGENEYPLLQLVNAVKGDGTPITTIPQLVYREGKSMVSTNVHNKQLPLDEYPFADYTDFFTTLKTVQPVIQKVTLPVWGSRGCPWNKCNFCVINNQFTYRTRSPENIVKEIEYQSLKYDMYTFLFMDSDIAGNRKRFETLLTLLAQLPEKKYSFLGTLSPLSIDAATAKMLQNASFKLLLVGFEAFTDTLLKKVRKRHTFAHNIQALKFAHQYGIGMGGLSILKGIPSETPEDILESLENIKFLRFLLNVHLLNPTPMVLYRGSPFYNEMSEKERNTWNYHRFWLDIAPTQVIPEEDRFDFFGFYQEKSHRLWEEFDKALEAYKRQNRSYTWVENENGSLIEEKGPKIYRYQLDRNETDILIFCDSIKTLSDVKEQFYYIKDLYETLHTLREAGLLYYDSALSTLISVVEAYKRVHE
jgi:radical SAM superfamily enzyme YgiQ (UPF0313 family)